MINPFYVPFQHILGYCILCSFSFCFQIYLWSISSCQSDHFALNSSSGYFIFFLTYILFIFIEQISVLIQKECVKTLCVTFFEILKVLKCIRSELFPLCGIFCKGRLRLAFQWRLSCKIKNRTGFINKELFMTLLILRRWCRSPLS